MVVSNQVVLWHRMNVRSCNPHPCCLRCFFFNLLHHIQHSHGVGVRYFPKHRHKLKGKLSNQCALGNSVEHIRWGAYDLLIFDHCRCLKSVTVPNQAHASICCTLVNRSFGQRGIHFLNGLNRSHKNCRKSGAETCLNQLSRVFC